MEKEKLLLDCRPQVHPTAYVAPTAVLLGDVRIEEEASIWFNCVLRGDVMPIRVGKRTNIQDLSLCHGFYGRHEVIVGDDVTVGHCAIIHACTVEDRCLIGMGAKILTGAVVGAESIVAAGAVVREGMRIPPRSLVVGVPAVVKKQLGEEDAEFIRSFSSTYLGYCHTYSRRSAEIEEWFRK
ncbi:MAG: gamma carbonic anhydrase family protein [Deltaproteobacteria bacterium]|nr:gamma carbonic anhydrase family protein [Deltaproteobacteria bacterium]